MCTINDWRDQMRKGMDVDCHFSNPSLWPVTAGTELQGQFLISSVLAGLLLKVCK